MLICGIDEAGRGTLAGSLFMAGVVLKSPVSGLRDSKKLTSKKREALFPEIIKNSNYHIFSASAKEIDEIGLSALLQKGLREIISNLQADRYIFDGKAKFGVEQLETVVGGDNLIDEISAASVLAKVSKDREMIDFGEQYPEWGFEGHKGYGSQSHIEAIEKFGYSPIHRRSFKIKKLQQGSLF
jgi:ribonuclease HII